MSGNVRIIAKSDGLDLYTHSEAVKDTAFMFNTKGNFKLDNRILYWASICHDIGKANPLFLENMRNNDFTNVMRHEIASILFIDVVPEDIRDIVALIILSHHKSVKNDERSLYKLFDEDEDLLFKNHINNIEEWGETVRLYFLYHYGLNITVPSKEYCKELLEYYNNKISELERGYSLYRGVFMMADHFASCFYNNEERIDCIDRLFKCPDFSSYYSTNEKYPLSLVERDETKKHTLCIAPTGCGKTNFMMRMCDGHRVFYTLPYQASINAMQQRLSKDVGDKCDVGIKHSSLMSLPFIDERIRTLSSFYGLPIKVITPFQIMETIMRLKGYESTILDLMGQSIIFDELHTYNSMTRAYILKMIEFLLTLNCSIHVCTATMPSYLQNEIIQLLENNGGVQVVKLDDKQLVTYNRHIMHTREEWDYKYILERYANGEKVLVVRNTIGEAQETYSRLKSMLNGGKIMLIHSRWKRNDRAKLEDMLINHFNNSTEPCIVVSTQVVEVSLDINFDVLFTDCADIMSLIQRFGRVNRQRKSIGILKDIFVVKLAITDKMLKGRYPYNLDIVDKTYSIFQSIDGETLEETSIQSFIDYVHNEPPTERFDASSPWNEKHEWKNEMYCNVLNTSISKELEFEGFIGILESDIEEYKKSGDKGLEIPLSFEPKSYSTIEKNGKIIAYILPNYKYDSELGLFL